MIGLANPSLPSPQAKVLPLGTLAVIPSWVEGGFGVMSVRLIQDRLDSDACASAIGEDQALRENNARNCAGGIG